ncbi:MAG: FlgD immunoglobulin-like domain containing protein [candidate division WOR-3 bacterium]
MKCKVGVLLVIGFIASLWAGFIPNVRVDHENRSSHACFHAMVNVGPSDSVQPVYVTFQNDSIVGIVAVRSDVYFQKSTDGGRTWLAEDRLIKRGSTFACYPDITTDPRNGMLYIVYTERVNSSNGHIYCVSSTNQGATWSSPKIVDDNPTPVAMGWARIAVDTAGNLFCAWNDFRTGRSRIWSSVSTDQGNSWSQNVIVADDTVPGDAFHADVFVQPGTNHYLVTATAPYWVRPGYINSNSVFYRSTDMGQSFEPGAVLDTFSDYCGQPHVVADEGHIICDFTGSVSGNQMETEARVLFTPPDSWSSTVAVTDLDTLYSSYLNGAKLAISPDGRVHTALMIADVVSWEYNVYYASSDSHGLYWNEREMVNDVTTNMQVDPDIAVDNSGFAYVVWQDGRNNRNEIWFSTNNQVGIIAQEPVARPGSLSCLPTVFCHFTTILTDAPKVAIYDATGRLVRMLTSDSQSLATGTFVWDGRDGANRRCPPGVYLVKTGSSGGCQKVTLVSDRY